MTIPTEVAALASKWRFDARLYSGGSEEFQCMMKCAHELESALASSAEPVAWMYEYSESLRGGEEVVDLSTIPFMDSWVAAKQAKVTPLYAHAPPAVPVESPQHCPKCRFTMSGVGRCVNCEPVESLGMEIETLMADHLEEFLDGPTAVLPASVPDGWQLVPVEPRLGMLDALSFALFGDARLTFGDRREAFRRGYAAMLAATPPTNQEGAAP